MRFPILLCALVELVICQKSKNSETKGKYLWDLLRPALSSAEIFTLLTSKDPGYPKYSGIPKTSFSCAAKGQPGFYADEETQCQVFHRCDQSLQQTDYLCVESTVFNQITLVCDSWYNVECGKSVHYENFANTRLYTVNQTLFDTPPAEYIAPSQLAPLRIPPQNEGVVKQN